MTLRTTYCLTLLCLLLATACNKAPDGVINENKMARLIADLNKAEYYVETHSSEFHNDSTRMALKQSIFAKHGVDQQEYDHSLEWYGNNMDVYTEVCDRAMRQLEDERKALSKRMDHAPLQESRTDEHAMPTYAARGDTADVWTLRRSWMLTAGMRCGTLRYDYQPDPEHALGDKYMLRLRVNSNGSNMTATLAADYGDGSTSTVTRPLSTTGWNIITLQTDSLRQLRRIYGYISYAMKRGTVAVIDSVSLIRTHLDRATYGLIGSQITVDRNAGSSSPARPAASGRGMSSRQNVPDAHVLRDQADNQARRSFTPKPGLNKSSHPRHIERSPNARHLP